MSLLRKPMKRVQGVKILCYGVDGSGKSVFGLSFPQVAVLDSESKVGVYEGDPDQVFCRREIEFSRRLWCS